MRLSYVTSITEEDSRLTRIWSPPPPLRNKSPSTMWFLNNPPLFDQKHPSLSLWGTPLLRKEPELLLNWS